MSWTNELYQVYENFHDQTEFPVSMVPIYHSSTKVQIEISIREDGEFSSARRLTKEEELTVLPVTEDSGARSSGIAPMPFTEKLIYLAADYAKYVDAKRAEECHKAYMEQLKDWDESDCTHPAVHALLLYLQKGSVMQDLIQHRTVYALRQNDNLTDRIPADLFFHRFIRNQKNLCFVILCELQKHLRTGKCMHFERNISLLVQIFHKIACIFHFRVTDCKNTLFLCSIQ